MATKHAPDEEVQIAGQTLGTGVNRINAESKPNKGAGVNVAVVVAGIDLNHPDLAANVVGGTNCSTGGKRGYDDGHGHGTHVAGIIPALDNGAGVVGVAPEGQALGGSCLKQQRIRIDVRRCLWDRLRRLTVARQGRPHYRGEHEPRRARSRRR